MSDNSTHYDIAVIGAGVAGLSVAYFLSPHARVVVLEQEDQPAYHSSGRSAAMFIEGYENKAVQSLTSAGRDFFFHPPEGFAEQTLVSPAGGLTVAGPGEESQLKQYLKTWQPTCPELTEITTQQARELVPILRTSWLSAAAYDPSWQNIDVHALMTGYQKGLRKNGGEVLTRWQVSALNWDAGQWSLLHEHTPITADLVVNTAGAWANHIAVLAELPVLPLTPLRRTAAIIPAPTDTQGWPLVHTANENLYFKPESPGLLVSPQDETPSEAMDAFPVDLDVAVALEHFGKLTDHPVERVIRSWAGLRTFSPDRHPIVGYAPQHPAFFWLAGQGGFGVQTSPGLGQLAADVILGRATLDEHLSVNRFIV